MEVFSWTAKQIVAFLAVEKVLAAHTFGKRTWKFVKVQTKETDEKVRRMNEVIAVSVEGKIIVDGDPYHRLFRWGRPKIRNTTWLEVSATVLCTREHGDHWLPGAVHIVATGASHEKPFVHREEHKDQAVVFEFNIHTQAPPEAVSA